MASNAEKLSWMGYAAVGYKAGQNRYQQGASGRDAILTGIDSALSWRIFLRSMAVVAFFGVLGGLFQGHVIAVAIWLALITPIYGVIYCRLIDQALFTRRFAYRLFAPLARPVRNLSTFWLYAMMVLPLWAGVALQHNILWG